MNLTGSAKLVYEMCLGVKFAYIINKTGWEEILGELGERVHKVWAPGSVSVQ